MITQEKIDAARKRLEDAWDEHGDCRSCGWHACLYEHDITDISIQHALEFDNGELQLPCISKDRDEDERHRGITIYIGE